MSGIYGVALSALNAAQAGLTTTGHNLANVNTDGYSRQAIVQVQGAGQLTGMGFIGQGTNVVSVRRMYADYLVTQSQALSAQHAEFTAQAAEMGRLSSLLSDTDANLGAAIDNFFGSVQQLAANPSDTVSRQAMLSGGQALVGRFQDLGASFDDMQARVDGQIRSSVDLINGYAAAVARLNNQITDAQGNGQPPNDLLDQRDALVNQLNREVRVVPVADGTVNLFLTNGLPLVLGTTVNKLVLTSDDLDPTRLGIGANIGGTVQKFRQGDITGGALGGMLAFRDQNLQQARTEVGRLAMALGAQFNDAHALGVDRNGIPGGAFFNVAAPTVAGSSRNTGTATLAASVSDYTALRSTNYEVVWDGANYVVTRLSDNIQTTYATLPQTFDGITVTEAGAPQPGDRFLVQPTRGGASGMAMALGNIAQIAAGAPIRGQAAAANTGTGSIDLGTVDSADPNLTAPVTLTFNGNGTFDVSGTGTGNPTGVSYTANGAISYNGWTVHISGSPQAGDQFTVVPNTGASGDNRNVLRLAQLAQAPMVDGNSITGAYARFVGSVGARTQEINAMQNAQQRMLDTANQALSSVSGVNLDEEAAALMRYQQAYQAAGKVINVANTLFDSLLNAVN